MEGKKKVYDTKEDSRNMFQRHGKCRINNRRPMNRYEMEKETESVSTSAKKYKMSDKDYEIHVNPTCCGIRGKTKRARVQ